MKPLQNILKIFFYNVKIFIAFSYRQQNIKINQFFLIFTLSKFVNVWVRKVRLF